MNINARIAAGMAAASAIALVTVMYVTSRPETEIRKPAEAASTAVPGDIKPIAADPRVVAAGKNARIDEIFASLEREGPTASMYSAMHDAFPDRYAEIKDTIRKEMDSGKLTGDPSPRIAELTREALSSFGDLIRSSSDDSLRKVAAAQYALLQALSTKDLPTCARYAAEGGYSSMPEDPEIAHAVAGLATVQINAAGEAAKSPKKREAPKPQVFMQLVQRMRAEGVNDQQIYALGDGKLAALPAAEQCRVATAMYHSTLSMRPEDAGTILAAIIKG